MAKTSSSKPARTPVVSAPAPTQGITAGADDGSTPQQPAPRPVMASPVDDSNAPGSEGGTAG